MDTQVEATLLHVWSIAFCDMRVMSQITPTGGAGIGPMDGLLVATPASTSPLL